MADNTGSKVAGGLAGCGCVGVLGLVIYIAVLFVVGSLGPPSIVGALTCIGLGCAVGIFLGRSFPQFFRPINRFLNWIAFWVG